MGGTKGGGRGGRGIKPDGRDARWGWQMGGGEGEKEREEGICHKSGSSR